MIRSCVMLCAVIVAESVPNFGPLLNLVGGSTATQCSLIFPTVFYLYLNAADSEFDEQKGSEDFEPKRLPLAEYVSTVGSWLLTTDAFSRVLRRTDTKTLALSAFIIGKSVLTKGSV